MKKIAVSIYRNSRKLGFDPLVLINRVIYAPKLIGQYLLLKKQSKESTTHFPFGNMSIHINMSKQSQGGIARGHYFHQDLLVARKIFKNQPKRHVDIGSRIDGFIAHIASFMEVEIFDIRPIDSNVRGIQCIQADLMNLDESLINSCDSISSLHVIEHFGLGRYGDDIDYEGYLKGLDNIYRILKPSGRFYFSTPIGKQRIEFNAHRVFSVSYLLELFKNQYEIIDFSYVDDKGDLFESVSLESKEEVDNNFGCTYGCGIFELVKK